MDENERIALQEREDERLAREMMEKEEQTAAAEVRRCTVLAKNFMIVLWLIEYRIDPFPLALYDVMGET